MNNFIKILGFVSTVIGVSATLLSQYVKDKKMDEKIEIKIKEALEEKEREQEDIIWIKNEDEP